MKPMYPKILPWLAGKAGIPDHTACRLWRSALREATVECAVIESPEYWQSAVEHLCASLASLSPEAALPSPPAASAISAARHGRRQMA